MSDIFISYASEDRMWAKMLAIALQEEGWSVWWDRQIPSGQRFYQVIEDALAQARCVVVVWSSVSVSSDWVLAEAGEAMRRNVLVPINIDTAQPPIVFRQLQTADLSVWHADQRESLTFRKLVNDIRILIGEPEGKHGKEIKTDLPKPDPSPFPDLKKIAWWLGSIVLIAVLGWGGFEGIKAFQRDDTIDVTRDTLRVLPEYWFTILGTHLGLSDEVLQRAYEQIDSLRPKIEAYGEEKETPLKLALYQTSLSDPNRYVVTVGGWQTETEAWALVNEAKEEGWGDGAFAQKNLDWMLYHPERNKYRLYLHLGSAAGQHLSADTLSQIRTILQLSGFAVLGEDNKLDSFGAGVDYFHSEDLAMADSVARLLNELIPDSLNWLQPRRQSVDRDLHLFGVWF